MSPLSRGTGGTEGVPDAFFDVDFATLLADPANLTPSGPAELDTAHLKELGRELSGQYVDVLSSFATDVFSATETEQGTVQVVSALGNLADLAAATDDLLMVERIGVLRALVTEKRSATSVQRTRFVGALRVATQAFAELLEGEQRVRMLRLVSYGSAPSPTLRFLRGIRGIGPRRLERMYLAGLHDIDRLCGAEPQDISLVTGMPLRVAASVVRQSQEFARQERNRVLHTLAERASWLTSTVAMLDPDDAEQRTLIDGARAAMAHLQRVLADLERP